MGRHKGPLPWKAAPPQAQSPKSGTKTQNTQHLNPNKPRRRETRPSFKVLLFHNLRCVEWVYIQLAHNPFLVVVWLSW